MKVIGALIAMILLSTGAAFSRDATDLRELSTAYDADQWQAVGRLDIGWGGMCTGALISPKVVLTAAHCLYNEEDMTTVNPREIRFNAGWRNGRATAQRRVRRAVIHPEYVYTGTEGALNSAHDIAILELDSEIRLPSIRPFGTSHRPRKGAEVGVVSYAHNRENSPSIQEVCHILARRAGMLIMSCDVDFGSSGAPIFTFSAGVAKIVSVVSAKGEMQGRRISIGTSLEKPLTEMMAILASGGGLTGASSEVRRQPGRVRPTPFSSTGGGAKFLRP